jgi:carbonic anhydrase/acetyltransferase-like protein (isoleucine patch superfamily)
VGAGAVVGEGAVVEDVSVIGPGASVPAGARLAGARLQSSGDTPHPGLAT